MLTAQCQAKESPKIQLATVYKTNLSNPVNIQEYFISEKLDGIRGFWNGKNLFTRRGNLIYAPEWFTQGWPNTYIDGELWSNRGEFEKISSCVRRHKPDNHKKTSCWQKIHFMLFDLPKHLGTFSQRIKQMNSLVEVTNSSYLLAIKQEKIDSITLLHQRLSNIVNRGGEGLMLHHQEAHYKEGRSNALMKLKQHDDAEAVVIAHIEGKGKYKNKMGSLRVRMPTGLVFKIGSGFTDKQRQKPPAIGSTVTFKYIGKTARGVPKFASFLRVRKPPTTQ
ncbi:MAG: DNA ligase-1 [Colwellia sp.]|jgi:DNA ligase-1